MPTISDRTAGVGGLATHWLEAPTNGATPVLYVHGVPTASWDWISHLERTGGIAPDLPGFGASAKPADFDYSIAGYVAWLETFSLVVHDWGIVGLALAQRFPERIERLVLHTSVPLLPGYRWHWVARIWRRPVVGELFMAAATKWAFRQITRQSNVARGPLPDWFLDRFWADFDAGTKRAILRLYRASPPDVLAGAGARLAEVRAPALVLWPTQDPYIGVEFGERFAEALGGPTRLEMIERAGHWTWLDRPEVIDRAAAFLAE
jgi:pimeloyl-ACP methyl ester carboxylesterase